MTTNAHSRSFPHPPEVLRPHLEQAWSGTDRDVFPRDVIRSWRKNPPGRDPLALVPGVTEMGHGPFRFLLERWDGSVWRGRSEEHTSALQSPCNLECRLLLERRSRNARCRRRFHER